MPPSLRLAFVMDPIERVDIDADTTFVFMLAAQERGHEVLYVDPADLKVLGGRVAATVTPVTLQRKVGDHVVKHPSRLAFFDDEIDVAFQRVDPPVDRDYITATQLLGLCRRTLVLNRPRSVLAHNEKIFTLMFQDLMPETWVSRRIDDLREFLAQQGGQMIVKPLDGKAGEGVFLAREGDGNLSSILEQATAFGTREAMGQQFIPQVKEGDKRILLLEGEPLGAVLRVPAPAEVRANLHVGGRATKTELTDADRRIIDRLGPVLREEGFFFVGIDVIGGLLTEINVTSPTGVQEVNALDGVRLELEVIERVEERVSKGVG